MANQRSRSSMASFERYIRAATRENTRRGYRAAIEHYEATWGGFLPATPDSLARYLADHAETHSIATLRQRLAALARWHRDQGFPDPTKATLVRSVLKGIREEHPSRPRQAKALAVAQLQQMDQWLVASIQNVRDKGDARLGALLRDRALVLLGFWRAFRGDELCRLRIEDLTITPGVGLSVYLARSKGDRQARGRTYKVPALQYCCPVEACQDWLAHLGENDGPVFRHINRWGHIGDTALHPDSIARLFRRVLKDAGVEAADTFSGHSFRRGFATWATSSGWDTKALMEYVGWRDAQSALRYVESDSPFSHALKQIPAPETSQGAPRLVPPSSAKSRKLIVEVALEGQKPRSRKPDQAREAIEAHCLRPFKSHRQKGGAYQIRVEANTDDQLEEQLYELIDEMHQIASDKGCWIEIMITDPATGETWD